MEKRMAEKFEHFVGSIAEDDVVRREAKLSCNCFAQVKPATVRIKVRVFQCPAHRLNSFGRRSEGILIGGQLNDLGGFEAELARCFLDRFSRLVDGNVAELWIRQLPDGSHARQNTQQQQNFPRHASSCPYSCSCSCSYSKSHLQSTSMTPPLIVASRLPILIA